MKKSFSLLLLVLFSIALTGCKRKEVLSVRRSWDISVDGAGDDWPDTCIYYPEKPGQALCFANDEKYLYLLLKLSDPPTIMQVVSQGLTIWFEPEGKNRVGIKYPTGSRRRGPETQQGRTRAGYDRKDPSGRPQFERRNAPDAGLIEDTKRELELLNPHENSSRLIMSAVSKSYGIDIKYAYDGERLVYELKLPLNKTPGYDFSLEAGNAKFIDISLISYPPEGMGSKSYRDQQPNFGDNSEKMPPGGSPPGGRPNEGRPSPDDSFLKSDKLELRFRVNLSP